MTALEFAQDNGGDVSLLGPKERQRLLQDWREIFARAVKAKTGKWVHLGYEWHAFSYQFTRSEGGARIDGDVVISAERSDDNATLRQFLRRNGVTPQLTSPLAIG